MAVIGCLGDIAFEVSAKTIKTLDNFKWSGAAKYSTHQRHGGNALTEFVSLDPDKISFDITLSAYLGINPMKEIEKIWSYERTGKTLSLVVGSKRYGKYRWTITNHDVKFKHYDKNGNVTSAIVSVNLQEYLNS